MENKVLFDKIDKQFKELDLNIQILKKTINQISQSLYDLDFSVTKLIELKDKFNKIDKMFKELDLNIQISSNLYKLDCSATKLEELKNKFNKIKDEK